MNFGDVKLLLKDIYHQAHIRAMDLRKKCLIYALEKRIQTTEIIGLPNNEKLFQIIIKNQKDTAGKITQEQPK